MTASGAQGRFRRYPRPESIAALRAVSQPARIMERGSGEHWAGRLYGRRVSVYLTRGAITLGLRPNTITMWMIVVGLVGCTALLLEGVVGAVICALLVQLYLVLDCVDGEVARWTRLTSAKGVYLDRVGHYVVEAGVFALFGWSLSRLADNGEGFLILGLVGAIGVLLDKAETDLVAAARLETGLGKMPEAAVMMTNSTLAGGRRLAAWIPLHRLTHAVEATLLIVVVSVADEVRGGSALREASLVVMVAIVWAIVALHLVSVYNSSRLTRPGEP